MRYSDVFGSCHPAVNFLYFVLVIAFSMCLTHPVCLLLSVCGAVIYHAVLLGPRSLRKSAVDGAYGGAGGGHQPGFHPSGRYHSGPISPPAIP